MEICSESGYGVVNGVGGHTECLRDGICLELQDEDISSGSESESESVVEKGVPLQSQDGDISSELESGKVVGKGVPLHSHTFVTDFCSPFALSQASQTVIVSSTFNSTPSIKPFFTNNLALLCETWPKWRCMCSSSIVITSLALAVNPLAFKVEENTW